MRKGFVNGMLTGGLIAAALTMMMAPQFKKGRTEMTGGTKHVKNKARRVIKGVKNVAEDWMK